MLCPGRVHPRRTTAGPGERGADVAGWPRQTLHIPSHRAEMRCPHHRQLGVGAGWRAPAPTSRQLFHRTMRGHRALVRATPLPWEAWAALVSCGTAGLLAERTRLGRGLSGPVSAMLIAAICANLGLLPDETSAAVPEVQIFTVKLATPLLLCAADLRKVLKGAGSMLSAFALGTIGTLLGAIVADSLLHQQLVALGAGMVGNAGMDLVGALTAKNIGGGLNYVAVASTVELPRALFTAGIAIDNIAAILYFPLVSLLGGKAQDPHLRKDESSRDGQQIPQEALVTSSPKGPVGEEGAQGSTDPAESILVTLSLAFIVAAVSEQFGQAALPVSTLMTVTLATLLPTQMGRIADTAMMLGKVLLFVFFACAGVAAGSIQSSLSYGVLFAFLSILYAVHLGTVLVVGHLGLRMDRAELLVASNANIGGPATAASLASAKGWDKLLVPGILVGNLGNAIATFLGLAIASWLGGR